MAADNAKSAKAAPVVTAPTPAPAAPPDPSTDTDIADPSRALGAGSPSCGFALDLAGRRRCRASGSAAQDHPLGSYGLDVRVGFSVTDPSKSFMGALQTLGGALWMGLLYAVRGVLLLLEWSFSLDLTKEAMPDARRTLDRLHSQVFGDGWLLLGISITALWGIWRGLVQRRTAETLAGLAATVALTVVALVVIARPQETVGWAAATSNAGAMAVIGAGTAGDPSRPRAALTNALAGVFETTVRDPWCALQFGSVRYCNERTGSRAIPTNADLWLAYPAQSWQRGRLHKKLTGEDEGGGFDPVGGAKDLLGLTDDRKLDADVEGLVNKQPARAALQGAGGTFPRLALLAMATIGIAGAIALYVWIGIRLLLASALTLLLLLIAPAMLLAPSLGEGGRATFLAWVKRLLGAIVAKFVFAVLLTVVLAVSTVFTRLELGWFGTWLLLGAFWWGIFLKREELIGFVGAGLPQDRDSRSGHSLGQAYYALTLGRQLRQAATGALRPAGAGVRAARSEVAERRAARGSATSQLAREDLDRRQRERLTSDVGEASEVVARREDVKTELGAVDRRLRGHDEAAAVARATNSPAPAQSIEDRQLVERRAELRAVLSDPVAREAEQVVRHADRNRALTGEPVTQRDLDVHRARRVEHLERRAPDPDRDGPAVGPPPDDREVALLAAVDPTAARRDVKEAQRWLDPEELRARTARELAAARAERRRRKTQGGPRR